MSLEWKTGPHLGSTGNFIVLPPFQLWQFVKKECWEDDLKERISEEGTAAGLLFLCFDVVVNLKFGFAGVLDGSALQFSKEKNDTKQILNRQYIIWIHYNSAQSPCCLI